MFAFLQSSASQILRAFGVDQHRVQEAQARQTPAPQQCRPAGPVNQSQMASAIDQYCTAVNGNNYDARFQRCTEVWSGLVRENGYRCTLGGRDDCRPAQFLPPVCPAAPAQPRPLRQAH